MPTQKTPSPTLAAAAVDTTAGPSAPHGTASWLAVVRAYHLCEAVMSSRLAAIGQRLSDHEVLATILTRPGITQQDLAARCFGAKSGISMLLAQMEANGLVRREADAADARVRRLYLSAAGSALARRTMKVQAEVVSAMAAAVSDAEMDQVADVMNRVSVQLNALMARRVTAKRMARRKT